MYFIMKLYKNPSELETLLGWEFFSSPPCPDRLWGPPTLLSNKYQGLFPWGQSGRIVKLTTHLHPMPRSRMCGVIPHSSSTTSRRGAQLYLSYVNLHLAYQICAITTEIWKKRFSHSQHFEFSVLNVFALLPCQFSSVSLFFKFQSLISIWILLQSLMVSKPK
jgi:hypothetical protein